MPTTDIPYIANMGVVFIETPEFIRKIDRIAQHGEFSVLQSELIKQPTKGDVERGAGGARKVRMKLAGRGKSGSARVVYYYVDLRGEIWLLDIFEKKDKESLSDSERNKLRKFIKEVINAED